MVPSVPSSALKTYRLACSVIGYAVWAYHRFALSLRDFEDLLAERGLEVSHETIPDWVAKFGTQTEAKIRRNRSQSRNGLPAPRRICLRLQLVNSNRLYEAVGFRRLTSHDPQLD